MIFDTENPCTDLLLFQNRTSLAYFKNILLTFESSVKPKNGRDFASDDLNVSDNQDNLNDFNFPDYQNLLHNFTEKFF